MEPRYYTGIGSRSTPTPVLVLMTKVATRLQLAGYTLRTGGAPGADDAFFVGAAPTFHDDFDPEKPEGVELYLPWSCFNGFTYEVATLANPTPEAFDHAKQFHPAWNRLSYGGKKLIARDSHQILGPDILNPVYSEFVICWTRRGKEEGGTAQAIRIAKSLSIPVFNLGNEATYNLVEALL